MKTVCLVMIVKNEAGVIARCLASVKAFIDHWVICDTGSTDNTIELIREQLRDVPGQMHQDEWINFGHNRTLAVQRAKGKSDYLLLINADETLSCERDFRRELKDDAYLVRMLADVEYHVIGLVSGAHDWKYIGPTHEYIHSPTAKASTKLDGVTLTHHGDGGNRKFRLEREHRFLSEALKQEPENARHTFYLAQTLREMGLAGEAADWYARRVALGGWEEEVFYSMYQIARLQQRMAALPWSTILDSYLMAYQYRPTRLEPLLPVARYYRETQQLELAYLFARPVAEMAYPEDVLFIEQNIYNYELPLEYALACSAMELHDEALKWSEKILSLQGIPADFTECARRVRDRSASA